MKIGKKVLKYAFDTALNEEYVPKDLQDFEIHYLRKFSAALTSAAEGRYQKGQKTMPFLLALPQGEIKGKMVIKVSKHGTEKGFDPSAENCGDAWVFFSIFTSATGKGSPRPNAYIGNTKVRFVVTKIKNKYHFFANQKDAELLLKAVMSDFLKEN